MHKFIGIFLLFFCSFNSYSAILRVNYNTGFPRTNVDYTTFSAAVTAAAVGDTIQIYGSISSLGTLNKRLVIQGFGYNFDVHPGLQQNPFEYPSLITVTGTGLTFATGSENSVLEGVAFSGTVLVQVSNITIRRCWLSIRVQNTISNINVSQSVVYGSQSNSGSVSGLYLFNCILDDLNLSGISNSSILITNCVTKANTISWIFGSNSVLVQNSIIFNYYSTNLNTVYQNNFFATAQPTPLPAGSNNRWGQNWANLFNRLGGTSNNPADPANAAFDELYYALRTGSAAINGGFDSANNPTDCGIFGGDPAYHYKISGLPAIPATYLLTSPGTSATTNPYNVTISVRSQD